MSEEQKYCTRCSEKASVKLCAESRLLHTRDECQAGDVWDAERGYLLCDNCSNQLLKILIPAFLGVQEANMPLYVNRMNQDDYRALQIALNSQLAKCHPM